MNLPPPPPILEKSLVLIHGGGTGVEEPTLENIGTLKNLFGFLSISSGGWYKPKRIFPGYITPF